MFGFKVQEDYAVLCLYF